MLLTGVQELPMGTEGTAEHVGAGGSSTNPLLVCDPSPWALLGVLLPSQAARTETSTPEFSFLVCYLGPVACDDLSLMILPSQLAGLVGWK